MEERICDRDESLSLELEAEGMTNDESKGGDCDEVMCAG